MPSLLERLVNGNGQHRMAEASLMIYGFETIEDMSFKDYRSDLLLYVDTPYEMSGWDASAEMDVVDNSDTPGRLPMNTRSIIVEPADTYTPVRLDADYDPDSLGRLNFDLAMKTDSDTMEIQRDGLLGHVTKSGGSLSKLSAIISILVETGGESGGLDPDDPEPEEPEPVEPSQPEIINIGGGIKEVSLQINPNSYYTLGIELAEGIVLNGVTGLDDSMKWDGYKQQLSGWVLGPRPKEVTVNLGADNAKLTVSAAPVSRHIV